MAAPVSTGLDSPSAATCLKRLPGTGDLLLIWNNAVPYAYTPANSDSLHSPRNPLSCAVSRDEGKSWEHIQEIENRMGYASAYPSVSFIGEEAFVTYYSTVRSGIVTEASEVKLKIFPVEWFYSEQSRREWK